MSQTEGKKVLLTGATGYIGSRLLPALEHLRQVRCLVRHPESLRREASYSTEYIAADLLDRASLAGAFAGVDTAYYLVHSMALSGDFEEKDRRAASNLIASAREAGLKRIIYLGGLAHGDVLSQHLASRLEVGRILRESGIPTIELQASIIIGTGSLSYEMIRALVNRLPIMVTPRWVGTLAQPIAIDDVIAYLLAALDLPLKESIIFEIGGPEKISYMDLMRIYAQERGLRRLMLPVPVLTPYLSSLWLGLVTPLQAKVGRKLIEGVRSDSTVHDDSALRAFPSIHPRSVRMAIAQAIREGQ